MKQLLSAWSLPWKQSTIPETPFFLFSEDRLKQLSDAWDTGIQGAALPVHLHFALKANNNPHVVQFFKSRGYGLDIVSGGELNFALKQGFKPQSLVFSGVGKTESELKRAVELGVGLLNIESESELDSLAVICASLKKKCPVSFRVNPDVDAKSHPYISTGLTDHKFGLELNRAFGLYLKAAKSEWTQPIGISVHIGSQLLDLSPLEEALERTLAFARDLKSRGGISLHILDVGGGLGVDYTRPSELPDLLSYGKLLQRFSHKWAEFTGNPFAKIFSECGRALVSQSGLLVSRVIGTKVGSRKKFLVVDAAMTELIRPALYQARHEIFAFSGQSLDSTLEPYDVVGPVCESADYFGEGHHLPRQLQRGHLVALDTCGAYASVMASFYNGRDIAAEYWLKSDGRVEVSRERLSFLTLRG